MSKLPSGVDINNLIDDIRIFSWQAADILLYYSRLLENSNDKRNYIVGSRNFKKYFGKNFKFSNFKKEVLNLKKKLKKNKIDFNKNTVRMKFYKGILKYMEIYP